jgi:hypothetical protein
MMWDLIIKKTILSFDKDKVYTRIVFKVKMKAAKTSTGILPKHYKSRESSVGTALGYRLDDRCTRVRFPAGAWNFSLHPLGPTQPPIQWVPGALTLGVKRPGHEVDHLPPSSTEDKEFVELYLHSPIYLHGVVLS